jgi:hypothetical protein
LDELPGFAGKNTTTEFLAHYVHAGLDERLGARFQGGLRVVLEESHVAWGAYDGPLGRPAD